MEQQFEVGFTMVDNAFLRYWLPQLTGAEIKVYCFVATKTIGWNKPSDFISTSQMVDGTGLQRSAVFEAGQNLMDYGLIQRVNGQTGKKMTQYTLLYPWRALVIAEGGDPDKVLDESARVDAQVHQGGLGESAVVDQQKTSKLNTSNTKDLAIISNKEEATTQLEAASSSVTPLPAKQLIFASGGEPQARNPNEVPNTRPKVWTITGIDPKTGVSIMGWK
jgi:phage replication O-like protein O